MEWRRLAEENLFWIMIFSVLLLRALPSILYGYPYLPGEDLFSRAHRVNELLQWDFNKNLNPPVYYLLMAGLVALTGFDTLQIMSWTGILISVLPVVVIYLYGKRLGGKRAIFGGFIAYFFLSVSPYLQSTTSFQINSYLTSHFLIPLHLLTYVWWREGSENYRWLFFALPLLIGFTHHLAFVESTLIVAVLVLFELVSGETSGLKSSLSYIATYVLMWDYYTDFLVRKITRILKPLIGSSRSHRSNPVPTDGGSVDLVAYDFRNTIWETMETIFNNFVKLNGYIPLFLIPVAGLGLSKYTVDEDWDHFSRVLFVWTMVLGGLLIVLRRERFLRDLVLPLSLLTGNGLVYLYDYLKKRNRKLFYSMIAILLIISTISVSYQLQDQSDRFDVRPDAVSIFEEFERESRGGKTLTSPTISGATRYYTDFWTVSPKPKSESLSDRHQKLWTILEGSPEDSRNLARNLGVVYIAVHKNPSYFDGVERVKVNRTNLSSTYELMLENDEILIYRVK